MMGAAQHLPAAKTKYSRKLLWTGILFILPALLYFVLIYWYPLLEAFRMSFQEVLPGLKLRFAGLDTYREVFGDSAFWRSFANTMYFTAIAVVGTVGLALVISIGLSGVHYRTTQNVLTMVFLIPTLVSFAAAGLIWDWILHPRFGLANQILQFIGFQTLPKFLQSETQVIPSVALIHAWVRVGFSVIILLAGLQAIPQTYFDAARVDGTRGLQLYRHITIPLLLPHIGAVTLLEVIFSLKVFDEIYITTQGGPNGASNVIMLYLYNNAFRFYRPDKGAVAAVTIFVVLLVFSILQRKMLAGRRYEY